eukprot:TRINITY_DN2828_c0_g1_i1.p1 TRINITY_DN2828_c0_g1~~TRINITY_DN2828_c0_g1_i1.p1  ORF type:complete len:1101 (-),score=229.55 TRINITY_DN2828_c0_g1_i1:34-3336(-)
MEQARSDADGNGTSAKVSAISTRDIPSEIVDKVLLYILPTSIVLKPTATAIFGSVVGKTVSSDDLRASGERVLTRSFSAPLNVESPVCLIISRIDFSFERKPFNEIAKDPQFINTTGQVIYGCLGIINFLAGGYLVVISERELIGMLKSKPVYKILETKTIQIPVDYSELNEEEKKVERDHMGMLDQFLGSCNFYFSHGFDITQSLQAQSQFTSEQLQQPIWKRADKRFFWNHYLTKKLQIAGLDEWIIPVMDGFIKITNEEISGHKFTYSLLSRRSCDRTGARYHTRGADALGFVANFVESEQIVENSKGAVSSFVQTRGTIPVLWHQKGDETLSLKPKPVVDHSLFTREAFRNHYEDQLRRYKRQVAISLIDQRGDEMDLGDQYETQLRLYNHERNVNPEDPKFVKYVTFDFHEVCKNNHYENLSQLVDVINEDLSDFGYFFEDKSGNGSCKMQTGGFRTNCVDCLDRTNVVQSLLAFHVLKVQFKELGIVAENQQDAEFQMHFKNVWADNADAMSKQYTGTGALKTDFTRTGKRSMMGIASDGINSLKRFVNKTFQDDDRQDAFDLFLGKYICGRLQFFDNKPGVHYYNVHKLVNEKIDAVETSALIEVNVNTSTITEYFFDTHEMNPYQFDMLKRIEHLNRGKDFRFLKLYFASSSGPDCFRFADVASRQQFCEIVDRHVFQRPHPEKFVLQKTPVFVGSWNMTGITKAPLSSYFSWIPKGSDIYVIGVQNCKYVVPDGFTFPTARKHLLYQLQAHLGEDFSCFAVLSTTSTKTPETTDTIALVHKRFAHQIACVHAMKVQQRPAQSDTRIGATSKILGSLKDGKKTSKDIVGGAIFFRLCDTELCFMNTVQNSSNSIFLIRDKDTDRTKDVMSDFHHVFWVGSIKSQNVNENKWITLHSAGVNGSILWRNLPQTDDLTEIVVGNAGLNMVRTMAAQSRSSQTEELPALEPLYLGVSIQVPLTPLVNLQKITFVVDQINLSNLISKINSKYDHYVVIYAPFLTDTARSLPFRKSASQVKLNEQFLLESMFSDQDYLDRCYLKAELWTKDNDQLIASGMLPLRGAFEKASINTEGILYFREDPFGLLTARVSVRKTV